MPRLAVLALLVACSSGRTAAQPSRDAAASPSPTAARAGAAGVDAGAGVAAAGPPRSTPAPPLVDVAALIPDAVLDLRYASDRNLTGAPLYPVARCLLHHAVADRLATAAATLRAAGYRLLLWDCYRPTSAQQRLWDRIGDPRYVAEPRFDARGRPVAGSAHSRGVAVDVSLADRAGAPLAMPTDHDAFGPAAHRGHRADDPAVRAHVAALDRAMTEAGFEGLATEWWHFAARGATGWPLLDLPL